MRDPKQNRNSFNQRNTPKDANKSDNCEQEIQMQMRHKRTHSMPRSQVSVADITIMNAAEANDSDEPTVYLNFDGPVCDSANEAISQPSASLIEPPMRNNAAKSYPYQMDAMALSKQAALKHKLAQ